MIPVHISDADEAGEGEWLVGFERHTPAPDTIQTLVGTDHLFTNYKDGYTALLSNMTINAGWKGIADKTARRIISNKPRYQAVQALTKTALDPKGIPWQFIAIIHHLESNGNFHSHLANGDPLTARTTHVPAGVIPDKEPPYTFEEAAVYALRMYHYDTNSDWSLPRICYLLEKFNGFGYRRHGINSPYLWSGTNNYVIGKYTSDGVWSPDAISGQLGAIPILNRIIALDLSSSEITAGSRKATWTQRLQASFLALFGSYFGADKLGLIPDAVNTYKTLGLTPIQFAEIAGVVIVYAAGSIWVYIQNQDYAAGKYTPSAMIDKTVNPEHVLT